MERPRTELARDLGYDALPVLGLARAREQYLTENMMILVDRNSGTRSSNLLVENHAYAIDWSRTTGNIEFSSRGPRGISASRWSKVRSWNAGITSP